MANLLEDNGYDWLEEQVEKGRFRMSGDSEAREAVRDYKAGWRDPENAAIRFDFGLSKVVRGYL